MKKVILSSVVALVALISVSAAFSFKASEADKATAVKFDNPHWVNGPCYEKNDNGTITIYGDLTGLGSGDFNAVINGSAFCINGGGNPPQADQWFNFTTTVEDITKGNGSNSPNPSGKIPFEETTQRLCSKPKWDFGVRNVTITIYNGTTPVQGLTNISVPECQ